MFDWSLDPRSQLALLCLLTAFYFWNNDALFFTFAIMAVCTRLVNKTGLMARAAGHLSGASGDSS